jgi:hypothetical protein
LIGESRKEVELICFIEWLSGNRKFVCKGAARSDGRERLVERDSLAQSLQLLSLPAAALEFLSMFGVRVVLLKVSRKVQLIIDTYIESKESTRDWPSLCQGANS